MPNSASSQRYHDLDALRAFAMLLGIVIHAVMSFAMLPVSVSATQDVSQGAPVYGWIMSAIHGFRMPLFFLVSGMFTALIWKRRGMGQLLKHRLLRIGVPLAIGTVTLVPIVFAINILGGRNIWNAATNGDSDYVTSYIASGGDVESRLRGEMLPGDGGTPLHLAVSNGQSSIASKLLDAGANPNAAATAMEDGQFSLASPLHWAAFTGNTDTAQLLIDRGARVNALDSHGLTALDYVQSAESSAVASALEQAGGLNGVSLDASQRAINKAEAVSIPTTQPDFLGDWIRGSSLPVQLFAMAVFFPAFVHLWFHYYLLWLVALFVVLASITQRLNWHPLPSWMFRFPLLFCWVLPPTIAVQLLMVQSFGPDTASGIMPWPPTLLYYTLYFFFGALYQSRTQPETQLGSQSWLCLLLALAILPIGIYTSEMRHENFWLYQAISCSVAALYAWLMIEGLFGLFRAACSRENKRVRYLSDAAYWIYLIHLPIVQLLQIWVSDWQMLGALKVVLIMGITTAISLATYEFLVRYSWIGAILHGRKYRQSLPTDG